MLLQSCQRTVGYQAPGLVWRVVTLIGIAVLTSLGCGDRCDSMPSQLATSVLDLQGDATQLLQRMPHVADVKLTKPPERVTKRIIHIADWHFVSKDDYAADLRSMKSESISDEELDRSFAHLLDQVEAIQKEQMDFLCTLAQQHGIKRVYVEGLAARDTLIFDAKVSAVREFGLGIDALKNEKTRLVTNGKLDSDAQKTLDKIEELEFQYRSDLLQLGAVGRLIITGQLDGAIPLEDSDAYAAANPVGNDGNVAFDSKKIETRQDSQAKLLLAGEPVVVVVLGGAHELSDNLERFSGRTAEYIRVELNAWAKIGRQEE